MQGFNMGRYRPPSALDTSLSTAPASKQAHPLGARARKLPAGILTVRFEMPYAIWCSTCPSKSSNALIGQGVRFNAEKKRVGNYFSTPVWAFRLKHTACGGWIEIRTDPKSSEYVVCEGARRRDYGDTVAVAERVGGVVVGTGDEEKERRRNDAFAALEGRVEDKVRVKSEAARLEELRSLKERDWRDVDEANRKLRATFRAERKEREKEEKGAMALGEKMSLGIEILPETSEDRTRASLMEFGFTEAEEAEDATGLAAFRKPLFAETGECKAVKGRIHDVSAMRRATLQQQLVNNTRVSMDPFVNRARVTRSKALPQIGTGLAKARLHSVDQDGACERSLITTSCLNAFGDSESSRERMEASGMEHPPEAPPLVQYDSD